MNGNAEGEWVGGRQAELVHHYKERMKSMLPYMRHLNDCDYIKWSFGPNYSAGPMPACSCGAAALIAIVRAEVEL